MARIAGYKVGWNKRAKPLGVILNIVMLTIWLYVGSEIITTIRSIIGCPGADCEASVFYDTFKFLGIHNTSASSGLVSIIGILLGVSVLAQAFRITRV